MSLLRLALLCTVLIAAPRGISAAYAEDFTGFYAGVNAGYAFDRDRRRERNGTAALPDISTSNDADGLPPSALNASQSPTMRSVRSARPMQH